MRLIKFSYRCPLYFMPSLLLLFLTAVAENYTWDTAPDPGIQSGSGVWSDKSNRWTLDGITLSTWAGAGNSASFTGNDGTRRITVSGSLSVDSITFLSGGYIVQSGSFLTAPKVYVAANKYDTITTEVSGTSPLIKSGNGCLVLSGKNSYTGPTIINSGTIRFLSIDSGGKPSSIGSSSSDAANIVIKGGNLEYTYSGIDAATDRLFTIGSDRCSLNVSMAHVHFTNSGAIALDGSGPRTLCIGGNGTAILSPVLGDKGGATSLQKFGSGTWILTGNNTYTGQTIIGKGNNKGTLQIGNGSTTGSICNSSEIINECILRFKRSDTCTYNGTISGNGILFQSGTGTLILTSDNNYTTQTTVERGSLIISGSLTSVNPLKVASGASLGGDGSCLSRVVIDSGGSVFPGVTVPGKLSVDSIVMSKGSVITFDVGALSDTLVLAGGGIHTLEGTVNIRKTAGFGSGTYRIISYAGTLKSGAHALNIGVSPDGYKCSLSAGTGYINVIVTSDSSLPPRIVAQTDSVTVESGDSARFFVSVTGTPPISCRWNKLKAGGDSSVAFEASFTIYNTTTANSGRYYCIVSNNAGTVISDTIQLTVNRSPEIKPAIIEQSGSLTVITGDIARFSVSVTGTPPISYRWNKLKAGGDLSIASESSFSINSTTFSDSGYYYCVVSNSAGTVISDTIRLIVSSKNPDIKPNLRARAISTENVRLAWDAITIVSNDKIRIVCSDTDIDTGVLTLKDNYRLIAIGSKDTFSVISGLKPATRYCFAIQAGNENRWSIINDASRTFCSTLSNGNDTDSLNSIEIDTMFFDSQSSLMRVVWCAGTDVKDMQTCITWGLSDYSDDIRNGIVINQLSSCVDTLIRFHPLRFDTLYYVALWLREKNGAWRKPTINSRDTVRTGRPYRQVVTLFESQSQEPDTVTVFNGNVRLWKDDRHTYGTMITDTLESVELEKIPEGMIVVGRPFRFRNCFPFPPLNIGISVDSVPSEYSIHDVRIYRGTSGKLSVNFTTNIDTLHKIVSVSTDNFKLPFIAMIDTARPEVNFLSDTGAFVRADSVLEDHLYIRDNISNVQWFYYYARGGEIPSLRQQSEQYHTGDSIRLCIPANGNVVNTQTGIRAYLLIDDGVNRKTINLSRQVIRHKSDLQTTEPMVWTPVYATASLFNKSAATLISNVADSDTAGYEITDMRLFRWVSYDGNRSSSEKWVEYTPGEVEKSSLFSLEPGRLLWLKTREKKMFHLDSGLTLSLRDTFTLNLPAQQWTDFGMPFRFGVTLQEIFSASDYDSNAVMIYQWEKDVKTAVWYCKPLYVPGMPDRLDRSTIIDFKNQGGYSLYNNSSENITMRIPPIPALTTGKLAKSAAENRTLWSVKFVAETEYGTCLSPVYFGYAPGVKMCGYPVCPSFSKLHLSVLDRKTSLRYGHHIDEEAHKGLISELLITNNSDTMQTIRYHLEKTGAFPNTFEAVCFDALKKQFDTSGTIHIAPKSVALRCLAVGDAGFRKDFFNKMPGKYSLYALYPNPSRSIVNIRYTVPFGVGNRIRIVIFNVMGKQIWEKRFDGLLREGDHTVTWNGRDTHGSPAASGLYIVRLCVLNSKGESLHQIDQRIRLMR